MNELRDTGFSEELLLLFGRTRAFDSAPVI